MAAGVPAKAEPSDAEKRPVTFSEKLSCAALLEIARRDREEGDWEEAAAAFEAACGKASSRDLESLAEYLRGLNVLFQDFEMGYLDLVDAALRLRLPKNLPRLPDQSRPRVPESLARCPESMREVAAYCQDIREPYDALKRSGSPQKDVYRHRANLASVLNGAITGSPAVSLEDVLVFYEVLCGCGRQLPRIEKSQTAAALLLLVRQERWDEVAGAAFFLRRSSTGADSLLALAEVDVEKALAGALALEQSSAPPSRRRLVSLVNEYLKCPGDGRVDTLIALARAAPPELLPLYIRALEKFLTKNPEPKRPDGTHMFVGGGFVVSSLDDYVSEESVPGVSAEASKRALLYLCELASPNLPNKAAYALANAFQGRYLEESYPALRKLLEHPAGGVVSGAQRVLENAGQDAVAPDIPTEVRYRLLVDGQPLKNAEIDVVSPEGASWSRARHKIDENGILSLGRDAFVDPHAPIREYAVLNLSHAKRDSLIFTRLLSLPKDETKVCDVEIAVHRLKIILEIPRFAAELEGKQMRMKLVDVLGKTLPLYNPASYRFDAPAGREFEFPRLAAGTYDLEISVPGCARWAGQIRVEEDREFKVALRKGSDISYRLLSSDERTNYIVPKVLEDGKEVELGESRGDGVVRGIPPGKYVLRVPSSADVRKTEEHLLGDETHFGSVDIPFVVQADSPALIDLGAISLPALPAGEK